MGKKKGTRETKDHQEIASTNFEKELNKHGHSFQYSVIRRAEELRKNDSSSWILEGSEWPVETRGGSTHIDLVFRHKYGESFLIGECKRVDPARGYWCFAKSPYGWRNNIEHTTMIFDEALRVANVPGYRMTTVSTRLDVSPIVHIGLEVRANEKGDGSGAGSRSPIIDTVTQALRGTSGLINYLCAERTDRQLLSSDTQYRFIPAVFTTARLFVTDADLATADLSTGYLPPESVEAKEVDRVWLNYNRSISLAHDGDLDYSSNYYYFEDFTRTVAIIGPNGIDSFLTGFI